MAWYKWLHKSVVRSGFNMVSCSERWLPLFLLKKIKRFSCSSNLWGWHHFGAINETLCEEFANLKKKEFEMSMLEMKQTNDGIFISLSNTQRYTT